MFSGRNDAEAETPILWTPHVKSWLITKDPDAGRDWGQEEKGTTEDEMAGWHHQLDAHEFEWTPGVGDGQGGLVCCDSWGRIELDTTEWLNWTDSFLCCAKAFKFNQVPLVYFWFYFHYSRKWVTEELALCHRVFCLCFPLRLAGGFFTNEAPEKPWKTVWRFFKKLRTELPYNWALPL